MALVEARDYEANIIKSILKEVMGDDYQLQLTKRCTLRNDDELIRQIRRLEKYRNIEILASQ